jgi:outer membrane protein assembly factor BamB
LQSWPQFRGPNRDGWSPGTNFIADWTAAPPKVLWKQPCGSGYSSLAIVGPQLYTMDRQGATERVLCLDTATGKEVWKHEYDADYSALRMGYAGGPRATPTVSNGWIYTIGATGKLLALKPGATPAEKPSIAWQHDLIEEHQATLPNWGVACSPLIEGELVIVQPGGKKGSVVAFDRITGEQRWTCESEPSGYSSPVAATLGGVRQIVAITGKSVLGILPATGAVLWKHPWETQHNGNIAMPVIAGDYIFISSDYGKGCATLRIANEGSQQSAKVVYFRPNKLMRNHHSSCVLKDGFLFGFDNSELRCVDLREGTAVEGWPADRVRSDLGKGSVILVGENLLCLSERGSLYLMNTDPKAFKLLGKMEGVLSGSECWALPVVLSGKIYLRDGSNIVCLDSSITK